MGSTSDLPSALPGTFTIPWKINNKGQVVGFSWSNNTGWQSGLLWQNGELKFLDDLIDYSTGWHISNAVFINDAGLIHAAANRYVGGTQVYAPVLLVHYNSSRTLTVMEQLMIKTAAKLQVAVLTASGSMTMMTMEIPVATALPPMVEGMGLT